MLVYLKCEKLCPLNRERAIEKTGVNIINKLWIRIVVLR